jgi:hypothetical protein
MPLIDRICERCGVAFQAEARGLKRGRGRLCSKRCSTADAREKRWQRYWANPEAWFWSWVDRSGGEDACWPWKGHIMAERGGYGRLIYKDKQRPAHRVALELTIGPPPAKGLNACHRCDNPPCVNPAHLWWGTDAENDADARQKGRKRGPARKVDRDELVRRREAGLSYKELAAEFGIHPSNVGKTLKKLGLNGPIRPNQNATLRAWASLEGPDVRR